MYHSSDPTTFAYYVNNKLDTPIKINGKLKDDTLIFLERDRNGKNIATLIFKNFKEADNKINGNWISEDSLTKYTISLQKDFDIDYGRGFEWTSREIIQSNTTKDHYFKTIITKEKAAAHGKITAVKVFEKRTDKLIQTIPLDCQLVGIDNVSVGDYNFDGLEDFSVLESVSVHNPNTSSIYILRDSNAKKYTVSGFKGFSLEFDSNLKVIYGNDQCCEGRNQIQTTYKVLNNQMVFIVKKCLKYDYKNEEFIEIECK